MRFTKMHALGNNYIYVNCFEETLAEEELASLAVRVANVHTGIGSDGMILICPSDRADVKMRVFNSDGSEARNCGNGLRCVAAYAFERGLVQKERFHIETLGGLVVAQLQLDGQKVKSVTIDMGEPRLQKQEIPMVGRADSQAIAERYLFGEESVELTAVSMGNPHAVIVVDNVEQVDVPRLGKLIEWDPIFPERVNVEFIQIISPTEIIFRVWERGSGITQACGTGACAAVVAGTLLGHLQRGQQVTVHLLGGDLHILWAADNHVYMTGPAEFVADGTFYR